jgi:hypothetical protein
MILAFSVSERVSENNVKMSIVESFLFLCP